MGKNKFSGSDLCMTSPVGIIVTLSHDMIYKDKGYDKFIKGFVTIPNERDNWFWYHRLSGRPKYEVLYFYSLWDGMIRYRSQIIQFLPASTIKFSDGIMSARAWAVLGGPVVKAPFDIPMKGFQGFRYCAEMF